MFETLKDRMDFVTYVREHLPELPARVLEVGCGREGGVAPVIAEAGYEVLRSTPRHRKARCTGA